MICLTSLFRKLPQVVLLSSLFASLAYAETEESTKSNDKFHIGVAAAYESAIYQGLDGYTYPAPLFDIRWGRFFISDLRNGSEGVMVGIQAFETENTSVSLFVNQGTTFLEIDDINARDRDLYAGIEDKDAALEYGFRYLYNSPVGTITWDFYKDFGDTYDAMRSTVRLFRETGRPEVLTVGWSLYVDYFSSGFNDYYYSITAEENEAGALEVNLPLSVFEEEFRPQWEAENSGHLGIDLTINKPIAQDMYATAYFALEEVLGEVNGSTIVEDNTRYFAALGILYKF